MMFADLVGSTALSVSMDPEDLREVISAYQKCVADTVRHFGGFVARYLGDGVKVYFGYPEAHEDDAERAVRAGLELTAAVAELKPRAFHQVRVGIATGLVVVGHLIPAGELEERGIVGETPNLASRLQGIAEPNMVVIAEGTRRLLGDLFKLQDLGRRDLKGIRGPVRTWAVLQANSVASRFEALHLTGLGALIGREEESALLLRRWERATKGEGQVVLLSGEPGIGKSRLTAAFMERLAGEPHTRLRYFCSPQHTDSPLHPIIGQMERAARLAHNDTVQMKLDKLDALLKQTSTSTQHAALIVDMLSLPNEGRYPALELTPQQRRESTLDALLSQMDTLTSSRPLLIVFEDAHWADATSLELFSRAVSDIASRRILLIVTFRPEFEPPWIGRAHVTALTIGRLTQFEVDGIIDQVIGGNPLPPSIRQDIIERSDGTPLFVEEMTKAVLEAAARARPSKLSRRFRPGASGPRNLARVADGAARPARPRQGVSADRGGDWTRVLPSAAGCGRAQTGGGAANSARPSHSGWSAVPARCAAARDLFFQACTDTGRSLQHAAARAKTRASCQNRRNPRKSSARRSPRTSLSCWHVTAPRPGMIEKAAGLWGKRGSGRRSARRWSKPRNNSGVRST